MNLFSRNSNFFSWPAPPMMGAAISLVVSACNVDEGATRSSLPPPDVSKSVAPAQNMDVDEEETVSATSGQEPAKDKPTANADSNNDTSDENVIPADDAGCRTLDDCAAGLVCVIKNDEGRCDKGVMLARGPLNQPPPPLALLGAGLNGSDAQ